MTRKALFLSDHLPVALEAAREAGRAIMTHYRQGGPSFQKADLSPVTEADREADRLIVARLRALAPAFPIVSEEGEQPAVAGEEYFWLVDPLDGTRGFLRGHGEFTVNIGLVRDHAEPVLGVIYDPVADALYWGSDAGAFRQNQGAAPEPIHVREKSAEPIALVSHSRLNAATESYLDERGIKERRPLPSSIKFCRLAEGEADLYPRFGPTMEWDTAAGHAILLAAGGFMTTPEGAAFFYGKTGFLNGNFVASGDWLRH